MNDKISKSKEIDMFHRKCFVFVLDIIEYSEQLKKKKNNIIANQILKTGTALGKNTNNLKLAGNSVIIEKSLNKTVKHIEKTKYLLNLCKYSQRYPNPDNLISDIENLTNSITKIKYYLLT